MVISLSGFKAPFKDYFEYFCHKNRKGIRARPVCTEQEIRELGQRSHCLWAFWRYSGVLVYRFAQITVQKLILNTIPSWYHYTFFQILLLGVPSSPPVVQLLPLFLNTVFPQEVNRKKSVPLKSMESKKILEHGPFIKKALQAGSAHWDDVE